MWVCAHTCMKLYLTKMTVFLTKTNLFEHWIASLLAYSKAFSCNPTLFCFTVTIFNPLLHFSHQQKRWCYWLQLTGAVHDSVFLVHFPPTSLAISFQCSLLDHPSSSQCPKVVDFKAQSSTSISHNILYGISPYPTQFHCFKSHVYAQDSQILSSTTNS